MRILVALDGSPAAQRALRVGLVLARRMRGKLELLNVQPPMPIYGMVRAYLDANQYAKACADLAQKALDPAVRAARRAGVAHRTHIMYGEPAKTVADGARKLKCGAIVMGTRGQGAVGNLVLGSVATKVIHLSQVPVTLVK